MWPISIRLWYEAMTRTKARSRLARVSNAGNLNFTQTFGHVHKIDKRFRSHLLDNLSPVLLERDFAIIELERDLFVK